MTGAATPTAGVVAAEAPYVGLAHFTEEYADRFFGRDTECSLIIGNLRASRLTLLYAESGVGKSSVLRAGVVARLRSFAARDLRTRRTPRLVPVVFSSWSERPVESLVRAIGEAVRPHLPEGITLDLPASDLRAALEAGSEALDATLLVILDQFEEYFLYPEERPDEERAAAQIGRCVNDPNLRANFLISIREDAYAQLGDLFRGRVNNVYGNFLHLDFLGRAGARESIEKPIERVNELQPNGEPFELEPALVDAVLEQVARDSGEEVETTYLQLVMRRLWEEETAAGSRRLRLATLERLGGAQAIIRGHLDRAMEGELDGGAGLSADQRRVAATVSHFLVTSGGTKIALTAKDLSDLSGLSVAAIEPVLQHLSAPGLHILRPVVAEDGKGAPRFEIFHDALARPIVKWRTGIEEAEREERLKRERIEKEKAQRAAAEAERREASERKRKQVALALLGIMVAALLIGAAYFAIDQSNLANERTATAQSVKAAERIFELSRSPTFGPTAAALASLEAYRLAPTREARNQALAALQRGPGVPVIAAGHTRSVYAVAYWPGSPNFASGGNDETVRLWTANGEELGKPLIVPNGSVESVAVSERSGDGTRFVAAGLSRGKAVFWRIDDSGRVSFRRMVKTAGPRGETLGLRFVPGSDRLLVTGAAYRVMLWDLDNPRHPVRLAARRTPGEINDLAFASGGKRLLVATVSGGLAWRFSGAGPVGAPTTVDPRPVYEVAVAPDGSYAFPGPRAIEVYGRDDRQKLRVGVSASMWGAAFARGGSVLVAGGADHSLMTWDVATGRPFGPPRTVARAQINEVAVSPDGETIAAAGDDDLIRLWPLEPPNPLAVTVGYLVPRGAGRRGGEITDLAVGAGSLLAASGGAAGTTLWKLDEGGRASDSVPRPFAWIRGESFTAAFHGGLLATAEGNSFALWDVGASCETMASAKPCRLGAPSRPHSDVEVGGMALQRYGSRLLLVSSGEKQGKGVVNVWDVTNAAAGGIEHLSTRRIGTEIFQVALSPAGPIVAVATSDGKMRVWNISNPRKPRGTRIENARGNEAQPVYTVAFSPDGRLLASAGGDQQVVLWKVASDGSSVEATPGALFQTQTIFTVAFSPDGKTLAAGDGDGDTCLYELEGQNRRAIGSCLPGHLLEADYTGIQALAFASIGGETRLLTAGSAQPVIAWDPILWDLSDSDEVSQEITDDICAQAGRNLTRYEWDAIFAGTKLADERHRTCPQYPLIP